MSEIDASIKRNIAAAFPTLIGQFQIDSCQSVNAGLIQQLQAKESAEASQAFANMGGWHSRGDLLEWPGHESAQLKNWISTALTEMVKATGRLPEARPDIAPGGKFRLTAWGNISRRGHYHRMHNHPQSSWSGVYYLTEAEASPSMGGVLELYDPRPFTEMTPVPGSPYGQRLHIRPKPGLMVLFPGWLYHFVHPGQSDYVRISIAFNASWIAK